MARCCGQKYSLKNSQILSTYWDEQPIKGNILFIKKSTQLFTLMNSSV